MHVKFTRCIVLLAHPRENVQLSYTWSYLSSIYLASRHLIANISKSKTPYRFHIGSLEEKLRREDDDLMTSTWNFNGEKYRSNGMSSNLILKQINSLPTYVHRHIELKEITYFSSFALCSIRK